MMSAYTAMAGRDFPILLHTVRTGSCLRQGMEKKQKKSPGEPGLKLLWWERDGVDQNANWVRSAYWPVSSPLT
jgi:hypothetical protein